MFLGRLFLDKINKMDRIGGMLLGVFGAFVFGQDGQDSLQGTMIL